jgi:hypothetical protein
MVIKNKSKEQLRILGTKASLALVAHACNPSYSGGRDQQDCSLKPAQAKLHKTLTQKTLHKNRAGGMAQGEGPRFKPQYHKKRNKSIFDII